MCSRKWAVPLVRAHSEREPASIQAPTVAVWALEFDSVATVRPLGSIVTCVRGCTLAPGLFLGPTWRVAAVASEREASGTRRLPLIEFARNRRADITTMWGRPRKMSQRVKEKNQACAAEPGPAGRAAARRMVIIPFVPPPRPPVSTETHGGRALACGGCFNSSRCCHRARVWRMSSEPSVDDMVLPDVWEVRESPSRAHSSSPIVDSMRSIVPLSDGEDDLQVESIRKLSASQLRRQKIDAARAAMKRATERQSRPPPAQQTLFSSYRCPICLCPPTNISVTPCGHVFCGSCLFDTLSVHARQEREYEEYRSGYGGNPFTPSGSSGALALANAAGADLRGTRALFNELVQQRQSGESPSASPTVRSPPVSASRLRATNGTERIKGLCPVCRSSIKGGFTGIGRRGVLGLEILLGTPEEPPDEKSTSPPSTPSNKRLRVT